MTPTTSTVRYADPTDGIGYPSTEVEGLRRRSIRSWAGDLYFKSFGFFGLGAAGAVVESLSGEGEKQNWAEPHVV